jgi:hypothetical protein
MNCLHEIFFMLQMTVYMTFPVAMFYYFNQPEFFEGWMMAKRVRNHIHVLLYLYQSAEIISALNTLVYSCSKNVIMFSVVVFFSHVFQKKDCSLENSFSCVFSFLLVVVCFFFIHS